MTIELRIPGESDEEFRTRAEKAALFAKELVEACLANTWTQSFIDDPELPFITERAMRVAPVLRLEYEQAIAIGGLGETIKATQSKHWGEGPVVVPLEPDDFYYPERITYIYRENSLYNRRFQQRKKLKRLLGHDFRTLVTRAKMHTKSIFLEHLTEQQAYAIRAMLGLSPGLFWRVSNGREFVDLPEQPAMIDEELLRQLSDKPKIQQLLFTWGPTPRKLD